MYVEIMDAQDSAPRLIKHLFASLLKTPARSGTGIVARKYIISGSGPDPSRFAVPTSSPSDGVSGGCSVPADAVSIISRLPNSLSPRQPL